MNFGIASRCTRYSLLVRLTLQNFTLNDAQGWECGPKSWKFPLIGKESPHRGEPFWLISRTVRGFYTPNYLAIMYYIWSNSLHRLQSYCRETARHLPQNFPCNRRENICGGSKNDWHLLEWSRRLLPPCKVWERSINARRLKVWKWGFVSIFCLSRSRLPVHGCFGGAYFEHILCHYFWVDFDAVFIHFLEVTALSDLLEIAYFRCQVVVTQFLQKHGGKLQNLQKKLVKSLCAQLRIQIHSWDFKKFHCSSLQPGT